MNKQHMWKLSSGKFVEEELYKLGQGLEFEQFVFMHIVMFVYECKDNCIEIVIC